MTNGHATRILIIDDDVRRHDGWRSFAPASSEIVVVEPQDVTVDAIEDVDVISVDEYLGDWVSQIPGADLARAANQPLDGLAVAGVLNSFCRIRGLDMAVALHSAELRTLAVGIPLQLQEPLTATQYDVDWVFDWGAGDLGERILPLAGAIASARSEIDQIEIDLGARWLEIPPTDWAALASAQLQDCRPPALGLLRNSNGKSLVRWLAQRILPFPSVLIDDLHGSVLLGVGVESLREIAQGSAISDLRAEYRGPLATFSGRRWWRAGLQALLNDAGSSMRAPVSERAIALSKYLGIDLVPLPIERPVVTYDSEARQGSLEDAALCVRLHFDGWPVFADDPWAARVTAGSEEGLLRHVALPERDEIRHEQSTR